MSEFISYLSDETAEMMRMMLTEMQNYNFASINFPILLYGMLNSCSPDESNDFRYYLTQNHKADNVDIEDYLSLMITDKCSNIQDELDKEVANKKTKSKNPKTRWSLKIRRLRPNMSENNSILKTIKTKIIFQDTHSEKIELPVDDIVYEIFNKALLEFEEYHIHIIQPHHFLSAMFEIHNPSFKEFLLDCGVSYEQAKKDFSPEMVFKQTAIPLNLSSFLYILNDKIDVNKPCEILKRDKECEKIWNIMLKKNKRNAVIVGDAGVGKSALVEKIAYDIKSGTSPTEFKDFNVVCLDVNSLIAGTKYRGDSEERISDLIKFLEKNKKVILFIDEVHTILGAGSCFEGEMDLANALKPILARGDTIVIGATTNNEYEKYFKKDAALSRRFEKVEVKEPLSKDVYPMIKNKLASLSEYHGVKITDKMVNYAILIASCFSNEKCNPDKTLDLIDRAMVTAKRSGSELVTKDSILHNFDIYFEKWENMSIESKKETAYHEAGHYIVGKVSNRLNNRTYLAISIMPAEYYLGITVMEPNPNIIPFNDKVYYIDLIAEALAGRVSEQIYTGTYTSGASTDLEYATQVAYEVVTKYGLIDTDVELQNRIYLKIDDGKMFSEKSINLINHEVNKLIDEAYKHAEELLSENKDILQGIVDALLEEKIMSEAELDKLWKEIESKRST